MQPDSASARSAQPLHEALLAYRRSPGKYQVTLRQPPLLFASVNEVLQLAIARDGPGVRAAQPPDALVAEAARFFVRAAMLYGSADHYALLGLDRSADIAALKGRYRLMMRLLHPDFAMDGASWPADAAVRLNLAYETLSSPDKRRDYDAARSEPARPPPRVKVQVRARKRARNDQAARDRGRRIAMACCFAIAMGLMGVLVFGNQPAAMQLVQRRPPPAQGPLPQPPMAPSQSLDAATPVADPAEAQPVVLAAAEPRPLAQIPPPAPASAPAPVRTMAAAALPAPAEAPQAPIVPPPPRVEPAPAPPSRAPAAAAITATVTMADAHPLLAKLLQHMENGAGERMLSVLEPAARSAPAAQALLRHYNSLVNGARPIRLSDVQFKAEPRDGHLLVTGHVLMRVGEAAEGAVGKEFAVQAEFALKEGTVVMTRLAGAAP